MTLKQHLVATGIAVAVIHSRGSLAELLTFSIGSILVDVDHLLFYYIRKGRYDIGGMFRYFREEVDKHLDSIPYLGVCVFHTSEFFLAIALLAVYFPMLWFLFAGLTFHIILDICDMIRLKIPFIRAYSLIEHCIRRRRPGYPYC